MPFGTAHIGRVARNEISLRHHLLKLREFTIMEIEFFYDPFSPDDVDAYLETIKDEKINIIPEDARIKGLKTVSLSISELIEKNIVKVPWLAYWMGIGQLFLNNLGIPFERTRFIEKLKNERAHYSAQTFDQEVYTENDGWIEVAGYAYRTNYDLKQHMKHSNADLTFFLKLLRNLLKKLLEKPIQFPLSFKR